MKWTKKDISSRLGLSSLAVYNEKLGASAMEKWREMDIPFMEICGGWPSLNDHFNHRDKLQIREIVREAGNQNIYIQSLHAPAPSDESMGDYASDSLAERTKAIDETLYSAEAALELSAKILVLHLGTSMNAFNCILEILKRFSDPQLIFVNENGKDLRDYVEITEKINSQQFGICIDIGHTRDEDNVNPFVKTKYASGNIKLCGSMLHHIHLHDFKDKDHYPPLIGDIKWDEIFDALYDIDYKGVFMFECSYEHENVLEAVSGFPEAYMKKYCNLASKP